MLRRLGPDVWQRSAVAMQCIMCLRIKCGDKAPFDRDNVVTMVIAFIIWD